MTDFSSIVPDIARCRQCGYALRGLTSRTCPECGQTFDPANPLTMDLGRRPGLIGRWLLRPVGWLPVIALLLAAIAAITATRWPRGGPTLSMMDLPFYGQLRNPRTRMLTYTDWAYFAAIWTVALVLIAWLTRILLRMIAAKWYRRPPEAPVHLGRRFALAAFATSIVTGSAAIGWPFRIARNWVRSVMNQPKSNLWHEIPKPAAILDRSASMAVLRSGLTQLPTARERLTALKLLIEEYPELTREILLGAVRSESDPSVLAPEMHLIGLLRDPATMDTLLAAWDAPHPLVRAAVTDAIGIVHAPAYPVGNHQSWFNASPTVRTDPAINFNRWWRQKYPGYPPFEGPNRSEFPLTPIALPDSVAEQVSQRMIGGKTQAEREAAARAQLRWQSGYRLRVAEWGVWIAQAGKLMLVQSILDEIPPFVHRIGDTLADMGERMNQIMIVDKPIIHFTTDRPMAVDVQVLISQGRPWFAYPQPDDFCLRVGTIYKQDSFPNGGDFDNPPLKGFDQSNIPKLGDAREGFPWLNPPHRGVGPIAGGFSPLGNEVSSIGLRWQSVIISPEKLSWMNPPAVPENPKYSWWNRLRKVPCAWVCNRGESERFLYYDGPTFAVAAVQVSSSNGQLQFVYKRSPDLAEVRDSSQMSFSALHQIPSRVGSWRGMFVQVDAQNAQPSGAIIELAAMTDGPLLIAQIPMVEGEQLIADFFTLLTDTGLTADEAGGLVDSWRSQFFQTPGSRFVLLMTSEEYDALCPLRVDPPPTELVRVGLILTEFGVT